MLTLVSECHDFRRPETNNSEQLRAVDVWSPAAVETGERPSVAISPAVRSPSSHPL